MLSLITKRSTFVVKQLAQLPQLRALSAAAGKRLFSKEHEWIVVSGSTGTVGISDHAQKALGDVVFVELPEIGAKFEKNDKIGAVESVKAVSDIYSPVSGAVKEINESLKSTPGTINKSCYKDGWLFKLTLTDKAELDELLDEAKYEEFLKTADH